MRIWQKLVLGLAASAGAASWFFGCTGRWCTSYETSLACDDFDVRDDRPAQQALGILTSTGEGAGAVISTNAAYSAPNGLVSNTSPFEGGAGSGVSLGGSLWSGIKSVPDSITCQFQMLPASLSTSPDDSARVFAFDLADPATTFHSQLSLVVASSGAVMFREEPFVSDVTPAGPVADSGPAPVDDSGVPIPFDAGAVVDSGSGTTTPVPIAVGPGWFQVKVTLSVGPPSTVNVTVGPASATGTLSESLPQVMSASVSLGAVSLGSSSSGWTFLFDNFVCF